MLTEEAKRPQDEFTMPGQEVNKFTFGNEETFSPSSLAHLPDNLLEPERYFCDDSNSPKT